MFRHDKRQNIPLYPCARNDSLLFFIQNYSGSENWMKTRPCGSTVYYGHLTCMLPTHSQKCINVMAIISNYSKAGRTKTKYSIICAIPSDHTIFDIQSGVTSSLGWVHTITSLAGTSISIPCTRRWSLTNRKAQQHTLICSLASILSTTTRGNKRRPTEQGIPQKWLSVLRLVKWAHISPVMIRDIKP